MSVGLSTEANTCASRSFPLKSSDPESLCENAMQVIKAFNSGTEDKWLVQGIAKYFGLKQNWLTHIQSSRTRFSIPSDSQINDYIENKTWVRGSTRLISSVGRDISRVSAANEK